jgi:hypothetical protein
MLDGLKVVVLALLLSGVAILAAFVVPDAESDRLSCVTGEEAHNVTMRAPDGHMITVPRHQDFDSIAEAENWICVDVPQAEVLPGWQIAYISAHRPRSVGVNDGTRSSLFIEYRNPRLGASVHLETLGPNESLGEARLNPS